MPNEDLIREIAARAWSEALQEKSQGFAQEVASRMEAALASEPSLGAQPPPRERCRELRDGTVLISSSRTQIGALETLLTASAAMTPECGLLIVRGTQAGGWKCIGITALDNFRQALLDCSQGVAATVLNSRAGRATRASELDAAFRARVGLESSAEILLLPVVLKESVAALLLAVSGSSDDLAALEVLVQVAQLALELQAYPRKPAAEPTTEAMPPTEAPSPAVPQSPRPEPPGPAAEAVASSPVAAVAAPPNGDSPPSSQPADGTHDKARRFARLLVEEIRLYNKSKVAEGRSRGDLYSRLRADIEKSRAVYQRRYGESVRDADYFTQELLRILADNDRTAMGAGFPG